MACLEMPIAAHSSIQTRRSQLVIRFGADFIPVLRCKNLGTVNLAGQPELLHEPDAIPIAVYLVPLQPVPSRDRVRVVIVVPAFAPRDQCNPPAIGRTIAGRKSARSPRVRR